MLIAVDKDIPIIQTFFASRQNVFYLTARQPLFNYTVNLSFTHQPGSNSFSLTVFWMIIVPCFCISISKAWNFFSLSACRLPVCLIWNFIGKPVQRQSFKCQKFRYVILFPAEHCMDSCQKLCRWKWLWQQYPFSLQIAYSYACHAGRKEILILYSSAF